MYTIYWSYLFTTTSCQLPCALYPITFPVSCSILFLIFVLSSSRSPSSTVHMYVGVCDHSVEHEQPTSSHIPRGECLPSLSCQYLFQTEWGLWEPIPNHFGILARLILCSNYSCYELMSITATSYPEASISQHSSPLSDSHLLSISSSTKFSESWVVRCW